MKKLDVAVWRDAVRVLEERPEGFTVFVANTQDIPTAKEITKAGDMFLVVPLPDVNGVVVHRGLRSINGSFANL